MENEHGIRELLKELREIRAQIRTLNRAKRVREFKELIDTQVDNVSSYIQEQAKEYRQNKERVKKECETIVQEYERKLAELKKEYEDNTKYVNMNIERAKNTEEDELTYLSELQQNRQALEDERNNLMNLSFQIATQLSHADEKTKQRHAENMKRIKEIDDELEKNQAEQERIKGNIESARGNIKDCKEIEKEYLNSYQEGIRNALNDSNNKLTEAKKQNVFKKAWGAILNTIAGTPRFTKNVVEKISARIETIKTRTQERLSQKLEELNKRRDELLKGQEELEERIQERGAVHEPAPEPAPEPAHEPNAEDDIINRIIKEVKEWPPEEPYDNMER